MKKLTLRLSEKTHEDLIRLADGRPLQQYLERMIDEAAQAATDPPREKRPARDVSHAEPAVQRGSESPSLKRFGS